MRINGMFIKAQVEALAADLSGDWLTLPGLCWFNTTSKLLKIVDGTGVLTLVDLATAQTLSSKTLTSPVLNTGVSGTAVLDEDNMATDSDTQLATQQSIKAYANLHQLLTITTRGDVIIGGSGSPVAERLAIGAAARVLTSDGTDVSWQATGAVAQLTYDITTKSADYTILDADGFTTILVDDTSAPRTITLPTAAANGDRVLTIKNTSSDGGIVTIDGEGAETIDGKATIVLYEQYESITIQCNGTAWHVIDRELKQTVWLKDVKATTVHGGTFTQAAWQTRVLNTVEGAKNWCALAANQFTLQVGTYEINAVCPAFDLDHHQAKLRNITDSTDDILGGSTTCETAANVANNSVVTGTITIAAAKVFEIQHYCLTTKATSGFGVGNSFGLDNIFTQVKITRIGG